MALFTRSASIFGPTVAEMVRRPRSGTRYTNVTAEQAMRHSAVWACLRLRANLISTLPLDVYRDVDGRPVEVPKPPVLVNPGGEKCDELEWRYSSQIDLDRGGNTVGVIREREAGPLRLPRRIDLAPLSEVTFEVRGGALDTIRIAGEKYSGEKLNDIWHEKQYTVAGLPFGLSPVANAAWTIGEYLSIQEFAMEWFSNSNVPAAKLKNKAKTVTSTQAAEVRQVFRESVGAGDLFVHGADWDYEMIGAKANETDWIAAKEYSIGDIARFFDCPGDMIDAAVKGSNITYARVDQRQLQLLVNNLAPAIIRRERALSTLLPRPRYVKLNTGALLRMDARTQAEIFQIEVNSRTRTPNQVRALRDDLPFTEADFEEFERLFGTRNPAPATATAIPGVTP
jgi:HK97 family phage portal protein